MLLGSLVIENLKKEGSALKTTKRFLGAAQVPAMWMGNSETGGKKPHLFQKKGGCKDGPPKRRNCKRGPKLKTFRDKGESAASIATP